MKVDINSGHYLELSDRVHILTVTIDDHVRNHPLTMTDKKLASMIDDAISKLSDIYQHIGRMEHEFEEANK